MNKRLAALIFFALFRLATPASAGWQELGPPGPVGRAYHTAVWTGSEMIVWGGYDGTNYLTDGWRFNPAADKWTPVSTAGAPGPRRDHTAVWTGREMIVWGEQAYRLLNTGGRYNPLANSWTEVTTTGAPAPRFQHTAVWTGIEMIVWGGSPDTGGSFNDGGLYNPATNSWTAVPTGGAPPARQAHTAVWTGSEMIVWGGYDRGTEFNDIFSYSPDYRPFLITSTVLSNGNLTLGFPGVAGLTYTLWRSDTLASVTWTNTGLPALTGTGATLTFTVLATNPARRFFRVQSDP